MIRGPKQAVFICVASLCAAFCPVAAADDAPGDKYVSLLADVLVKPDEIDGVIATLQGEL